jgi:hypothetical protein
LWFASSHVIGELASDSAGALLVSPFNVEWGCYAWAGGVEESKFCLFLVVFPVKCISIVSLIFYFMKCTFCFFPLVAILESLLLRFWKDLSEEASGDSTYSCLCPQEGRGGKHYQFKKTKCFVLFLVHFL